MLVVGPMLLLIDSLVDVSCWGEAELDQKTFEIASLSVEPLIMGITPQLETVLLNGVNCLENEAKREGKNGRTAETV